ncbi:MAG TPA: hypothetical protein VIH57_21455 [Bacteroidales bacterium]
MILKQSINYKKEFQSNVELPTVIEYLIGKLQRRGFLVKTYDNRIDFDYIAGFTTNSGENRNAALRILRHGKIILNENQDFIRIKCECDIRYILVMSICFGLAMFGLNLLYSEGKILNSFLVLIITSGLIFGIGLFSLWMNVKNLIRK